jgi:hypothetical protein
MILKFDFLKNKTTHILYSDFPQAAYSFYENKDNGNVMSKEEQQKWNATKKPETPPPSE